MVDNNRKESQTQDFSFSFTISIQQGISEISDWRVSGQNWTEAIFNLMLQVETASLHPRHPKPKAN
jgi:hypothetical protein